jgi:predicted O-methyltransferase YrrM
MSLVDLNVIVQKLSAGSISVGDLDIIARHCMGKDRVVELGTNIGSSTIAMACCAKQVFTVDIFEKIDLVEDAQQREAYRVAFEHNQHTFEKIKERLRPFPNIDVTQSRSYDAAAMFHDQSVDTLFIDADHSISGVSRDYEAWLPKMKQGGLILFHDCVPGFGAEVFWLDYVLKDPRVQEYIYYPIFSSSIKIAEVM